MKKGKMLLAFCGLLITGFIAVSCSPQTSSTSSSSLTSPTQLVIGGPKSCKVGEQITLVADIIGDDEDEVIWSSLTPEILSINDNGVVTGLMVGKGKVKAESSQYNLQAEYEINVTQDYAKAIELVILNQDELDITILANGTIKVPVGQTIELGFEVIGDNVAIPDSASYSIVDASEEASNISLTTNSDKTGTLIFMNSFENIAIKVSASYLTSIEQPLVSTKYFTSFEKNADNLVQINNLLPGFKESELKTASKANVTYEYNQDGEISSSNLNINYYQNSVYSSLINQDNITHTLSSIDQDKQMYYLFDYNYDNKAIETVYDAQKYDLEQESTYVEQANLGYFFVDQGVAMFGFDSILNAILNDSTYRLYPSLGDYRALAYASFEILTNSIKVTSYYHDEDFNVDYEFNLTINHQQGKLLNYVYEVIKIENNITSFFKETAQIEYNGKSIDNLTNNSDYIDINRYYISDFDVKDIVGLKDPDDKWDFSDTTKFGYSSKEENNGIITYYVPYHMSLPLQIYNVSPSTASLTLDNASIVGISSNGTRNFSSNSDGTFAISAPKDTTGNTLKVIETFTISTLGGGTYVFKCSFIDADINAIIFKDGNACLDDNTFHDVFVGSQTGYFYLNTDPDDTINHHFGIEIVSGPSDGLELFQFGDDNIMGYPGFAYGLKTSKVGNYQFRFYVLEASDIKTQIFSLTVNDIYTSDFIKENIVGNSYIRSTDTSTYTLTFASETLITFAVEDMYSDEPTIQNINYSISDGKITIDGDEQFFNQPFYFSKVKGGGIVFEPDFSSVSLFLEIYSSEYPEGQDFYSLYSFKLQKDTSDMMEFVNGQTYVVEEFLNGTYGRCSFIISFKDGKGTLTIKSIQSGDIFDTLYFDYSYNDGTYKSFTFLNVSSDNGTEFKYQDQDFNPNEGILTVNIKTSFNTFRLDYDLFA